MEHKLGAIFSPNDVRDYRLVASTIATSYPASFEIENMPEVKNQGKVGSCVAHAISTVIEYHSRKYGDDNRPMSVGYIYGNRKNTTHTGEGMITRDAVAVTCEYGDVPHELFPYNREVPEIITKFNDDIDELYNFGYPQRFSSYYRITNDNEAKATLMKGNPIVMTMTWYEDIRVIDGVMTTKMEKQTGGHCMVIYGWNETGWLVQNSWGTGWGTKGRVIIPYDIPIREKYGIIDEISEQKKLNEIKALQEENKKYLARIYELEDTISSLLIELDDLEKKVVKLTKDNVKLFEDSQKLQENMIVIDALNKNIKELSTSLGNAMLTIEKYKTLVKEKEEEIARLTAEITELKKPFQSRGGKIVAKFLNTLIKGLDWLLDKLDKKR